MTVWRELSKYKLNLMGVQEVRWEGGACDTGHYLVVVVNVRERLAVNKR
jgi:hypothetical protein